MGRFLGPVLMCSLWPAGISSQFAAVSSIDEYSAGNVETPMWDGACAW